MGLLEDAEQHREARRKRQQRSIIVAAKGLLILFGALVLLVALAGGLVLGLLESWHFLALILRSHAPCGFTPASGPPLVHHRVYGERRLYLRPASLAQDAGTAGMA